MKDNSGSSINSSPSSLDVRLAFPVPPNLSPDLEPQVQKLLSWIFHFYMCLYQICFFPPPHPHKMLGVGVDGAQRCDELSK